MTAAQLAEILDPQHEVDGWWCTALCEGCDTICYFGPSNLHTAREHAWRMEVWLEARNVSWFRNKRLTVLHDENDRQIHAAANHAAALAQAVERISK
jgi:hypothetical protein